MEHDVYHLPGYSAACAEHAGSQALAFWWTNDRGGAVLLPLLIQRIPGTPEFDACSPYGYPGPATTSTAMTAEDWRAAATDLVATLADLGVVSCFVRLNPLLSMPPSPLPGAGVIQHHGDTVVIDLREPIEAQWAQMRSNHRRDISQSRAKGHRVRFDPDWAELDTFIDIYRETMERVGAQDSYFFKRDYFDLLRQHASGHLQLVLVDIEGDVAAGGIFFEAAGIVQYHLGATRFEHLRHQPTKLMFDEVRRWAVQRGDHSFHLGGGVGGRDDQLLHFKAGFSKQRRAFRTWRLVIREAAYRDLTRALRPAVEPDDLTDYFPAYRSPVPRCGWL